MKVVIDDCRLEKMDVYTEPLEAKIRRQAAEITRLLAENEKLKAENGNVIFEIEQAFDRGCNAAWELAKKIVCGMYYSGYKSDELKEIFGYSIPRNIFETNKYQEAAEKIAEWEQKKEEICVGDVVIDWNGDTAVIIQSINDAIKLLYLNGKTHNALKGKVTKTGRHIDVNAWLAQIGGETE